MTPCPRKKAEEVLRHFGVLFPATVVDALATAGVLAPDTRPAARAEARTTDTTGEPQ